MSDLIKEHFSYRFEPELIEEMEAVGKIMHVSKGETMIHYGEVVDYMPILMEGAIKIMREDKAGDELLLYFLEAGDTCTMTLTHSIGKNKSAIRAEIEQDATLVLIPVDKMPEWIQKYKSWMNYVFESYHIRMQEMLETIDVLSFMDMQERLFKYLIDKVKILGTVELSTTHQEIAHDLHTSRVVVSRLLKKLEQEKKISLHRSKIHVLEF